MSEVPQGGFEGSYQAGGYYVQPEPTGGRERKFKRLAVAASVVGGLIFVGGLGWFSYSKFFAPTLLERAYETCEGTKPLDKLIGEIKDDDTATAPPNSESAKLLNGVLLLEDSGRTLIVSTNSKDSDPLGFGALAFTCVADEIDIPAWVSDSISTTRALDGRQDAEWDGFKAQWNYHPNSGLNLIITEK